MPQVMLSIPEWPEWDSLCKKSDCHLTTGIRDISIQGNYIGRSSTDTRLVGNGQGSYFWEGSPTDPLNPFDPSDPNRAFA